MKAPSILVADDSEEDVFFLKVELKASGLINPMHVVTNGEETIRYLAGDGPYADREQYPLPALLLLDLKMPRKTGFDVLEWMKAQNVSVPVIVLSAMGAVHQMSRVYQLGARGFVVKPVLFRKFISAVKSVRDLALKEEDGRLWLEPLTAASSPTAELAVA